MAAPYSLDGLTRQAQTLSAADVNAQVAAIRAQQAQLEQAASAHAAQINAASRAAAGMLGDVGDQTAQSYRTAAGDLAALAHGYSGDLQTPADQAAQQVSQGLAAIGAPVRSVPAGEQSQNLGNLLYGLGGAIPGATLLTAGQAQAGAQRQLPASTLGYGMQQAQGALAAGDTAARGLMTDILQARAGQGAATRSYLGQLVSAENAQQNAEQQAALLPYLIQKNQGEAAAATAPRIVGSSGTGYYTVDPATGAQTQIIPPRAASKSSQAPKIIGSTGGGYYRVDPNGKVTSIVAPKASVAATKARKLTPEQLQRYTGEITDTIGFLRTGVPTTTSTSGKVSTGKPALNYTDALRYMRQHGYMATPQLAQLTLSALAAAYPPAEVAIGRGKAAGPPAPSATAPPGV